MTYIVRIPILWGGYEGAKRMLDCLADAALLAPPELIVWEETEEGIILECTGDEQSAKMWEQHFKVERRTV